MISTFPTFTPLEEVPSDDILAITTEFEPYSDFNLTSLTTWNTDKTLGVATLHGNLIVKMPDYTTGETVYSLIGSKKIDQSVEELLMVTPELRLIPEVVVSHLKDASHFVVTEDIDNFDYIYSINDLAVLPGGSFKKKRNKLHKLMQETGDTLQVYHSRVIEDEDKKRMLQIFDKWASLNARSKESPDAERKAFTTLLYDIKNPNLVITFVKQYDEIIAFSVNEILSKSYAICHFEKAISEHDQMYTLLANSAAIALAEEGAELVNWEQDLGIAGLRSAKMSYHPTRFLRKYTITKK